MFIVKTYLSGDAFVIKVSPIGGLPEFVNEAVFTGEADALRYAKDWASTYHGRVTYLP